MWNGPLNSPRELLNEPERLLLEQAQRLLEQGDLSQARALWLSLVQAGGPNRTEHNQSASASTHGEVQLHAWVGLAEIAARQRKLTSLEKMLRAIQQLLDNLLASLQPVGTGSDAAEQARRESLASTLNCLSERLGNWRAWSGVKKLSRLIIKHFIRDTPQERSHRIRALNNLGSALLAENRFDDAIHIWKCTLQDYSAKAEATSPIPLATVHNNLAELLRLRCQIAQACQHHRQALRLRLVGASQDPLLIRQSRLNLAQVLIDAREFNEAREQIETCLRDLQTTSTPTNEQLRPQLLLTRIYMETGLYRRAEENLVPLLQTAGDDFRSGGRFETETHLFRLELAWLLNKTSIIRGELERIPELISRHQLQDTQLEARYHLLRGRLTPEQTGESQDHREAHTQQALQILRKRMPRNHPATAQAIFQLADLYAKSGRGQRAVQTANSAMAMLEQTFGDRSPSMLHALTEMGAIVLQLEQFRSVRQLVKLGLQLQRELATDSPLTTYRQYRLLQASYAGKVKLRLAAYYARAAWRLSQEKLELAPTEELTATDQACRLSHQAGQVEAALPAAAHLVELYKREFHSEHPRVYQARENWGRLLAESGNHAQAADCLSGVLSVRCAELGEESTEALELMELTADLLRRSGKLDEAERIEEQMYLLSQKASHVLSDLL